MNASLESLRINLAVDQGPHRQHHELKAVCLRALRADTPRLIRLTRLDLPGFHSIIHAVSTALALLATQLRCLRLPWCRLFMEQSDLHTCPELPWPGMLSTLCALEDLDLSGNSMSQEPAGRPIAAVSHLPLRRLALVNVGLDVVSALTQMHTGQC